MNRLLKLIDKVEQKAQSLGCTTIAVLAGYVLCYRAKDETYITWQAVAWNNIHFNHGYYDMTCKQGYASLVERAEVLA